MRAHPDDVDPTDGTGDDAVLAVMLDAGAAAEHDGRLHVRRIRPSTVAPDPQRAPADHPWHETLRRAAEVTMNGSAEL